MKQFFDFLKNNAFVRDFLDSYGLQLKKMAVICLTGLVLFAGFSLFHDRQSDLEIDSGKQEKEAVTSDDASDDTVRSSAGTIFVDVGGAVKTPMLAELPDGSRVDDAIKAAGGLNQDADMTNINRAEFLVDGQKIYIPSATLDEDGNIVAADTLPDGTAASGKVNINTADSTQLQTLNGVGPATAQKIIDYRQSNGSFSSVEDIRNVSGIGEKTYEKLKDHITI